MHSSATDRYATLRDRAGATLATGLLPALQRKSGFADVGADAKHPECTRKKVVICLPRLDPELNGQSPTLMLSPRTWGAFQHRVVLASLHI
jgi:hypothetical protein